MRHLFSLAVAVLVAARPVPLFAQVAPGDPGALERAAAAFVASHQPDSALARYRAALARYRAASDPWGEARVLWRLAHLHHRGLARPDLGAALAYYDSAAQARSLGTRTAFRAAEDTAPTALAASEVHWFSEWALARLASDGGSAGGVGAALAIAERGRSHRLLNARTPEQDVMNLLRIAELDPTEDGERLAFWAMGLREGIAGIVSYLVTPDTVLIWVTPAEGEVALARHAVPVAQVTELVAAFRRGLGVDPGARDEAGPGRRVPPLEPLPVRGLGVGAGPSEQGWREAATRLGALLLPEALLDRLPASGELIIIPDGVLNLLPFTLLPLGSTGETLGGRHTLRYAPSLSALGVLERGEGMPFVNFAAAAADTGLIRYGWKALADSMLRVRAGWLGQAVVVGDPRMPMVRTATGETRALPALPGAGREAVWVARELGVTPLQGAAASEAEVGRRLGEATVLHLATHGYAYLGRDRVLDSFVALAPAAGKDGLLTVGEVLRGASTLRADLVVLSACQTAVGSREEGEGVIGLQYAFLARGARSVLVSLWSVNDEATEKMMRSFYTHWLGGDAKSAALQRAQEEVRRTPGFEHPRYWAAFQLVGAQ